MRTTDEVERKVVEGLMSRQAGVEPPVIRIYTPNPDTGTHQIIFQDRLVTWTAELAQEPDWAIDVETAEYRFLCSPANIAEVKVRLKPAPQIWLRTADNLWVAQVFRWSELQPDQLFQNFVAEGFRLSNPPKEPHTTH